MRPPGANYCQNCDVLVLHYHLDIDILYYHTVSTILILVAPCFKESFKIRSWVPSPQMP